MTIIVGGYQHHGFTVPLVYPHDNRVRVLDGFYAWEEDRPRPRWVTFHFPNQAFVSVPVDVIRALPVDTVLH